MNHITGYAYTSISILIYDICMQNTVREDWEAALKYEGGEGDPCWIWPRRWAGKRPLITPSYVYGYEGKSPINVHRAIYIHMNRCPDMDSSILVLHSCGNGYEGCVAPGHLYVGDDQDNRDDWRRHGGRIVKLESDEISIIIRRNDGSYMYRRKAAEFFGVSVSTIDVLLR